MWHREAAGEEGLAIGPTGRSLAESACRRAYYRVEGILPIRLTPLRPEDVEAAIFDLALPDPLQAPIDEGEEDSPLAARMRRIEEKLDLLLGNARVDVPRPLTGRDRRPLVFSGSGIRLEVDWAYRRADPYRVEILLPPPYLRLVRAVARAVDDPPGTPRHDAPRPLALRIEHMPDEDRDALVAYSYDLQRIALRARVDSGPRA